MTKDDDMNAGATPAVTEAPGTPVSDSTPDPNSFTLFTPIVRGDLSITRITLRRPNTEALRGTQLAPLAQMDVDQVLTVLPRITSPILTAAEVARMDPADLMKAAGIITGFLFPAIAKEMAFLAK